MRGREKRILLLLPEVFASAGGIQMFCRALCLAAGRWAEENNATVTALVLNDGARQDAAEREKEAGGKEDSQKAAFAPDARYVGARFSAYVAARQSKARLIGSYVKHLAVAKPDVMLCGHVSLAPLLLLAPHIKSVVFAYGIEVWRALSWAERRALRQADAVLAISDYTRDELIRRNELTPAKVKLFPCALDPYWTANAADEQQQEPPLLLTVSRLTRSDAYKGIDSVIESLPKVIRECGAVDYRVVGSGDDLPRLRALAERLGVADYVTFTGRLGDEALQQLYRRASVFVLPSEGEGFGIVFLEAMAYGKAIIGGAHCGTPSVVADGETGLLVKRSDTEALASAIIRLLQDRELRRQLGRAGQQRLLDNFVFARFEEKLAALLSSALSTRDHLPAAQQTSEEVERI